MLTQFKCWLNVMNIKCLMGLVREEHMALIAGNMVKLRLTFSVDNHWKFFTEFCLWENLHFYVDNLSVWQSREFFGKLIWDLLRRDLCVVWNRKFWSQQNFDSLITIWYLDVVSDRKNSIQTGLPFKIRRNIFKGQIVYRWVCFIFI